ncbi:MAG: hypothetical protein QNJ68_14900 [Microcoleaceae cyanobacterium MO_207.B10]|nr:hypothetical protein [Microcoleaceae cyanobacterium MO_207.B10]
MGLNDKCDRKGLHQQYRNYSKFQLDEVQILMFKSLYCWQDSRNGCTFTKVKSAVILRLIK